VLSAAAIAMVANRPITFFSTYRCSPSVEINILPVDVALGSAYPNPIIVLLARYDWP
jgi:hypothetical protein